MSGNSFLRNSAYLYGTVYLYNSQVEANCNIFEDEKSKGKIGDTADELSSVGAALYLDYSTLDAKLNVFTNNTAGYGGAIYAYYSKIYSKSNKFTLNTAKNGGALYGEYSVMVTNADTFANNEATVSLISPSICKVHFCNL
jgi:predicted outer membrane repeat protein